MRTPRTVIAHERVTRGSRFENLTISNVKLIDCHAEQGPADDLRPTFKNCTFSDIQLQHVAVMGCVFEDVTVTKLANDKFSGFLRANEYARTKIVGRFKNGLVISARHYAPSQELEFTERIRQQEQMVEWTLDLSEAHGELDLRGYDPTRVKIDPERQAVVTFDNLIDSRWKTIDFERTYFYVQLETVMETGSPGTILSANEFLDLDMDLRVIQRLRDAGIAT